jgi:hypothetical protein
VVDRRVLCGRGGLLCLSSGLRNGRGLGVKSLQGPVEVASKVALEAASYLLSGPSFRAAPFDVGSGFWVVGHSGDDGHV